MTQAPIFTDDTIVFGLLIFIIRLQGKFLNPVLIGLGRKFILTMNTNITCIIKTHLQLRSHKSSFAVFLVSLL